MAVDHYIDWMLLPDCTKGSIKTSVFIIMWALYAISEVHGLDAYLCFPILMISTLLDNKYKRESSKR